MSKRRAVWPVIVLLLAGGLAALFLGHSTGQATAEPAQTSPRLPVAESSPNTATAQAPRAHTPSTASAPTQPTPPLRQMPVATATEDASATHGAFEGRVVSATRGEGVAEAELTFASDSGGASSVRTDPDGRFRFLPSAPGTYQLATVTAKDYLPFGPEWGQSPIRLTASPGRRISDLVLALTPVMKLQGRVQSPDGEPIPGAHIRVLTGREGESVLFPSPEHYISDANGEFRVQAPEGATVEARHPDYASARTVVTASTSPRLILELSQRADAPDASSLVLSGRVVDTRSEPVVGARVFIHSASRAYPIVHGDPNGYEVLTDDAGSFTAEGLPPGTYDISARRLGLAPTRLTDVAAGRTDLLLTLARGTQLVGTVRAEDSGQPIPSFFVEVLLRTGHFERESVAQVSFVDSQGRFEVGGLSPGSYEVQVVAPGHVLAKARVEVPQNAPESLREDFILSRGVRLTGRVVEADLQRPIENAIALVEGLHVAGGMGTLSLHFDAISDEQGLFVIDGLAPGTVSLHVSAEGYHSHVTPRVSVNEGDTEPLEVTLRKTGPGEEPKIELVGIGAVLSGRGDALVLGEVIPGGGAAEAGLVPGDAIVTVDGALVTRLGFPESVGRIRGPEHSIVLLGVRRGSGGDAGSPPVMDVPVTRGRVQQ